MKGHDEEDLRLSVAVQKKRLNTMKAEYETGQADTRADIARYAAEGAVRDARHAENVAKREAQHAATIRTIYAFVFGGVGLTVLSVGFIIGGRVKTI